MTRNALLAPNLIALTLIAPCAGLVACGGSEEAANGNETTTTAGAEAPPARTARQEAEDLVGIFWEAGDSTIDGAEAVRRLRAARYADEQVEGVRSVCVAALDEIEAGRATEEAMEPCSTRVAGLALLHGIELQPPAGETPQPFEQSIDGELVDSDPRVESDDSPYDDYEVQLLEGWTLDVAMQSTEFDTYLWLIGPDGTSLVQHDDIGEQGDNPTDSFYSIVIPTTGRYVVRANSYDGSGRGHYRLLVRAGPRAL